MDKNATGVLRTNARIETEQQPEILKLPPEMLVCIAEHVHDAWSLLSFRQTCRQFAQLSRVPGFVKALNTDVFARQRASLWMLDLRDRPARIHQLACGMAASLQPDQLRRMFDCLDYHQQEKPAREHVGQQPANPGVSDSDTEPDVPSEVPLAPEIIGAAISSGRVAGFGEELKRYASKLMTSVPWLNELSSWTLAPADLGTAEKAQLKADALHGIWNSISAADISDYEKSESAFWSLRLAGPIRMAMKLPLLTAIMNAASMGSYCVDVAAGLDFFAENPEVIDVALAEQFFGTLCKAWNRSEKYWPQLSRTSWRLVKLLPPVPWRKNSQSALLWFEKLVTCRFVYGRLWEEVEQSIPSGIFTGAELAYLSQHKQAGDFSWEAFVAAFSEGSVEQAASL